MPFDPPPNLREDLRKVASVPFVSPIADLLVKDSESLADALARLDAGGAAALFVVDAEGRLQGRIGPAEIAAALARGLAMDRPLGHMGVALHRHRPETWPRG